jgi:hypothetical protein
MYLFQNERAGIAYRNSGIDTFKDGLFFATDLPPMKYLEAADLGAHRGDRAGQQPEVGAFVEEVSTIRLR